MTALDPITVSLWLYATQAVAALVLGGIFAYYHFSHRHTPLRLLAFSFVALASYMICAGASTAMVGSVPSAAPLRQGLALGAQIASYLQIVLLMLGTLSLSRKAPYERTTVLLALGAALIVGVICSVAYLDELPPALHRLFLRVGLRHAVMGLSCVGLSLLLLGRRAWGRGLGMRVVSLTFLVYGAEQLLVFGQFVSEAMYGREIEWSAYLGIFDAVSLPFLGLGLLIWLLDDEHDRAKLSSEQLAHMTRFDTLTGLANQRQIRERLADLCIGAKMFGRSAAVVLVELDRFDVIARSLGTDAGNTILRAAADRLQRAVEPTSLRPARLEGQRFVVLLHTVSGADEVKLAAQRILRSLVLPYRISGQEVLLGAHAGVALCPEHAGDPDSLIDYAGLAATRARESGAASTVKIYESTLKSEVRALAGLQVELRRALLAEQFELEYQPVVKAGDHSLVGFEALVRWRHPERGFQSPALFLGTLEEMGLMAELDGWVLEQACRQGAEWNKDREKPVWIAVNVTAQSFRLSDFTERVVRVLERTKLMPTLLDLEITESTALADVDQAISYINTLRQIGVSAALDDFGTGYSSLAQLRRLPVGKIKIDRSFITDPRHRSRDGAIVRALVSLAHGLDLKVLIEGVETEDQLKLCERAGCDMMQGYLFSMPLPAEHCTRLLESGEVVSLAATPAVAGAAS